MTRKDDIEKWTWDETVTPNSQALHKMVTLAIVYAVKRIFATHVYRFDGTYYLQGDKGPIGHIVTESI